jgi:NADH-quinone oxidoreductase subunit I
VSERDGPRRERGAAAGPPGGGLARGLAVTLRTMSRRSATRQYPDVPPDLPPRSRGVIALFEENCTVCMLCARECPDWCIYIDSHKETIPAREEGARARQRNVLDRFAIDFALCMYCGICIEACPFDALFWSPEFEYAEYDILDLTHERDRLRDWMWTVPPPPAHDPDGETPKEVVAAESPPGERAGGGRAGGRPAREPRRAGGAEGGPGREPRRAGGAEARGGPGREPRRAGGPEAGGEPDTGAAPGAGEAGE